ncbi:hypothetical protein D1872_280580 [compost metagenome]
MDKRRGKAVFVVDRHLVASASGRLCGHFHPVAGRRLVARGIARFYRVLISRLRRQPRIRKRCPRSAAYLSIVAVNVIPGYRYIIGRSVPT